MKKQFFRVKQLADQTFSRAGKTEVLTDDLQAADKHVEQIRSALTGLSKRFGNPPNQAVTQDTAYKEKRLKKCSEHMLGQTMLENGAEDGLMTFVLWECGKTQMALAEEVVDHETKVDQFVAAPLQHILDTEIPNILKHKRNLARLTLDMDSARTRYVQASKHVTSTGATKIDSLKEELEEAESKVEQCRDQLAAEMFQLLSRETELAQTIIQYVKLQRAYHESASHCLNELIPKLETFINTNEMKPVYGYPLEEHLRVTNRKIALPIQLCVSALLRLGMEEEGLFRIAGGASKLRRIKLSFDACCLTLPTTLEYKDPHVIAGALKSYLRELPEPLLTYKLYSEWMAAAKAPHGEARLHALWDVLHKLPTANLENLRFLIKFLAILTKNQDVNKMSVQNIAIVIAPNLIWSPQEDKNTMVMNMSTANTSSLIVDQLITYADWFFPGDIDFDRDLEVGIVNGSESQVPGMRRCVSNSSLSDHGESPPQGSPKPATRRKNKPAPTPPSCTPERYDRRCDEKPPPAPDKPPRPITSTLNRATYRAQKHEVTTELVNRHENSADKPDRPSDGASDTGSQAEPGAANHVDQRSTESCREAAETHPPSSQLTRDDVETERNNANVQLAENRTVSLYERNVPPQEIVCDKALTNSDAYDASSHRPKPAEKPAPSTLERRKLPIAAPRSITNVVSNIDDGVELRKKSEIENAGPVSNLERNSKPAIPERPAGLMRPSSLLKQYSRNNENVDMESGPLTLERAHVYSVEKQQVSIIHVRGNGNACDVGSQRECTGNTASNLQRSPSVGSRPSSMSLYGERPDRPPPRPEAPVDHQHQHQQQQHQQTRVHARTRSEGNIIDVQTQTDPSASTTTTTTTMMTSSTTSTTTPAGLATKSPQQSLSASPRCLLRPPRPQPPPPPPPTVRPKTDAESTNL